MFKKIAEGLRLIAEGLAEMEAAPSAPTAALTPAPSPVVEAGAAPAAPAVPATPAAPAREFEKNADVVRRACGTVLTDLFKEGKQAAAVEILNRFAAKVSLVPDEKIEELYRALGEIAPLPF